jgi:hypothetical protein
LKVVTSGGFAAPLAEDLPEFEKVSGAYISMGPGKKTKTIFWADTFAKTFAGLAHSYTVLEVRMSPAASYLHSQSNRSG